MDTALQRYDKRYFSEKISKLTIGEIALLTTHQFAKN